MTFRSRWHLCSSLCALLASSCTQSKLTTDPTNARPDPDQMKNYVLIEFASKLEEDYHRVHPIPDPQNGGLRPSTPTPQPVASPSATP
jgi:hypothetical protein